MASKTVPLIDGVIERIPHLDGTRDFSVPSDRMGAVRRAAQGLHEEMMGAPPVRFYRSFDLVRVPYPRKYALRDACSLPTPYVHILNRMFIVQVDTAAGIKTILVSPSDVDANKRTPFFARLTEQLGAMQDMGARVIAPVLSSVPECLAKAGIVPEQVDYITYDHLHTQDLRRWLGGHAGPGLFPNAQLLVMRQEWESALGLLPPQRDWYCPGGIDGVPPEKVTLLDGDVRIGSGFVLMRTPGHTEGNHSIAVRTPEGVMVTSENGVSPDCYAPLFSKIPGVRKWAHATGMEVVLNGNTLEGGLDQYISMVAEKTLAGPSSRNPDFPNIVCSSELAPYWLFPGIKPTLSFGELCFGAPALLT